MAKRKTYDIPEYIDHMEQEGLLEQENVSKGELIDSYIELSNQEDPLRDNVISLRAKGFDDNRIAAKLLIPLDIIKSIN
jgi:hypothetical protein